MISSISFSCTSASSGSVAASETSSSIPTVSGGEVVVSNTGASRRIWAIWVESSAEGENGSRTAHSLPATASARLRMKFSVASNPCMLMRYSTASSQMWPPPESKQSTMNWCSRSSVGSSEVESSFSVSQRCSMSSSRINCSSRWGERRVSTVTFVPLARIICWSQR